MALAMHRRDDYIQVRMRMSRNYYPPTPTASDSGPGTTFELQEPADVRLPV